MKKGNSLCMVSRNYPPGATKAVATSEYFRDANAGLRQLQKDKRNLVVNVDGGGVLRAVVNATDWNVLRLAHW